MEVRPRLKQLSAKEVTDDQSSNGLGMENAATGLLAVIDQSNGLRFAYGGAATVEANRGSNGVPNDQSSFGGVVEADTLAFSAADNVLD